MTQKELLYFEDAIGHESNIIKIVEEGINNIQDPNLKSFLQNELNNHNELKNKLTSTLEGKINEWSINNG